MSPSSRGLGHHPFTVSTGVRIPLGTPVKIQRPHHRVRSLFLRDRAKHCFAAGGFEGRRLPAAPSSNPGGASCGRQRKNRDFAGEGIRWAPLTSEALFESGGLQCGRQVKSRVAGKGIRRASPTSEALFGSKGRQCGRQCKSRVSTCGQNHDSINATTVSSRTSKYPV
jgi:hypothetical protein